MEAPQCNLDGSSELVLQMWLPDYYLYRSDTPWASFPVGHFSLSLLFYFGTGSHNTLDLLENITNPVHARTLNIA